ncbi:helix-turn-helix domain-containing protein [Daejeonella lutea]|uniref:HTH cro/C1-type domain-containing protein n=1 Tax=Daejeonella lutea TaxID=572036 RepID=A0A1T5DYE7_9SPHI|nr:helix-turn-helix domain-containing protein [Daejeonella lutea]SKB76559.1 hypothetical protein SAMN05661099_2727 [Daejeonella lutea]
MAPIKEILKYTPDQWLENQSAIAHRMVSARESLALEQEWVAGKAGYSITQYQRLENGERFIEFYDFLRIGEVFYMYQESLQPEYMQTLNKLILWGKCLPYRIEYWLDRLRCFFD